MVFIAQGTSLVLNNRVLFKEPVEAWKYGPVIPELYQTFKNYGNQNILSYAGHSSILADGSVQPVLPKDDKICELLDEVWAYFGSWTGIQLSAWTHRENSAWDIAYNKQGGKNKSHFQIDPTLIKQEFEKVVETA